jgi:deoxycytidylate deaminase
MKSYLFQACKHAEYAEAIAKSANAEGYHFGAIVFKGYSVISTGWCQCKTHPKQARYMRYAKPYKKHNSFLHAEMHALITAKGNASGCDLIIARWADGELRPSYPCGACLEAARDEGIRNIWHYAKEPWPTWVCTPAKTS